MTAAHRQRTTRPWPSRLVVAALLAAAVPGCQAPGPPAGAGPTALHRVDPGALAGLRWRFVGPFRGGRSVAVAGDPSRRLVFYLGATGGGVWKTENGGLSWRNVSDGHFGTGSVGAIAVAPSDPDVVVVGMGESCIRGNNSHGDGVYRSDDGGATWSHLGLEATRHIARIRIHPRDPDTIYAAAFGDAWGPNHERGVYRSRDGGRTWEQVLFVSDRVGAIDLSMDPRDPRVLYAAMWEAQRFPWGLRSAGPGSGIYRTTDGGDTWRDISDSPGLPAGVKGRIGIAVSPADSRRVYTIIEAEGDGTGLYRSDDAGRTWQLVSSRAELHQRPWYYHHIYADPAAPDTVYVLNTALWRSTDGGRTFTRIPVPHGDNHDLWIDPRDPRRMVEANDGGATVTFDGGRSWSTIYNQPTAQVYHVTTDNRFPYWVYGAQQDNSTVAIPSRSDYGAITPEQYYPVGGGEAGAIAVHPRDPAIVFAADHHWLTRYDHRTGQVKDISPWPEIYYGWGPREMRYRFQWTYPVLLSPHDPETLYVAAQVVFRSRDRGESWEIISPDLTRADPVTLEHTPAWDEEPAGEYWGPIKRDNTGVEWYATIFALAESPVRRGLLWAGSDDGLVHLSRDGGRTWDEVTPEDLPEFALISVIEPSPHDPAVAYLAATRYKLQDNRPYLYRTRDYGESWTPITDGIPGDDFTRVVREDPARPGLLYAGTETGVYVSFDDGENWQPLRLNLPVVPVHDLALKDGDLVAATHGRGFWILDDISVLRQLDQGVLDSPVHLFAPRAAVRVRAGLRPAIRPVQRPPEAAAPNPPAGVVVHYYLREKPAGEVALEFLDGHGNLIRRFSSAADQEPRVPAEAGGNRFVWDLRHPGPLEIEGAVFRRYRPRGPLAIPGTYEVRLTVGDSSISRTFQVVKDPRLATGQRELEAQLDLLLRIRDRISETHRAVLEIRELRERVGEVLPAAEAEPLLKALYDVEDHLIQFKARATQDLINYPVRLNDKLSTLAAFVEMADAAPTRQHRELYEELTTRLRQQLERLAGIRAAAGLGGPRGGSG